MLEFRDLLLERKNLMLAFLESGTIPDLTKLREICKRFNNRCVAIPVFAVEGTDQELFESVNTYLNELLKKS